ncbi:MAG: hypothetical protein AAFN30_06745 [Actinomycetota bacterium]
MFRVGDTEFGIDPERTEIRLGGSPGSRYLVVNISGDATVFDPLDAEEGSPWKGTLYPPEFQLFGGRCEELAGYHTELPGDHDRNNLELAFYMLSHRPFEGRLSIDDGRMTVIGRASWRGEWLPVHIETDC